MNKMSAQLAKKFAQFNIKRFPAAFAANQSKYYSSSKELNKGELIESVEKDPKAEDYPKTIMVKEEENIMPVTERPLEHTEGRLVRIYQRAKNSMQSGTDNTHCWEMEFETRQRWENSLIGWCSSGDPLSNMKLQFPNKETAAKFAQKNGFKYYVEYERKEKPKVKSYAFNFSWNKRTRVTTK